MQFLLWKSHFSNSCLSLEATELSAGLNTSKSFKKQTNNCCGSRSSSVTELLDGREQRSLKASAAADTTKSTIMKVSGSAWVQKHTQQPNLSL